MVAPTWPCPNHPGTEVQSWCEKCGTKFCRNCLQWANDKYYCFDCMSAEQPGMSKFRIWATWRKPRRKWVAIIGGGLFGFAMSQVLILIITSSVQSQSTIAFVYTIIGLFVISAFLGSILAGFVDKEDAALRGVQAVIVALVIYMMVEFAVWLLVDIHSLYIVADMFIIIMILIPIVVLGGIGGKIGGSLRPKYRELK